MIRVYSVQDAALYIRDHLPEMVQALLECDEVPAFMKGPDSPFAKIWCAGSFLTRKLREHGATDQQVQEIGFCHGQRSFGGDTLKAAVDYLNEFCQNNQIEDKPGAELGERLLRDQMPELFSRKD